MQNQALQDFVAHDGFLDNQLKIGRLQTPDEIPEPSCEKVIFLKMYFSICYVINRFC